MRRKIARILSVFIFLILSAGPYAFAQYDDSDSSVSGASGGRYILVTVSKPVSATSSYTFGTRKRTPAIVLDTYLGVVWRCQDIKDSKLLWIRTDLAKKPDTEPTVRKYVINVPAYTGEDNKMPAIVLDIDTGKTWINSDITDPATDWLRTDLPKDVTKEGYAAAPY